MQQKGLTYVTIDIIGEDIVLTFQLQPSITQHSRPQALQLR